MRRDDAGGGKRRGLSHEERRPLNVNTPVDFVDQYLQKDLSRLHMPGHKGQGFLGCEARDITEIPGADVLDQACGIIAESEANAAALFQTGRTFYSTEGSSLSVKAMLALAAGNAVQEGERPLILAARNVHKTFLYGCARCCYNINNFTCCTCSNGNASCCACSCRFCCRSRSRCCCSRSRCCCRSAICIFFYGYIIYVSVYGNCIIFHFSILLKQNGVISVS